MHPTPLEQGTESYIRAAQAAIDELVRGVPEYVHAVSVAESHRIGGEASHVEFSDELHDDVLALGSLRLFHPRYSNPSLFLRPWTHDLYDMAAHTSAAAVDLWRRILQRIESDVLPYAVTLRCRAYALWDRLAQQSVAEPLLTNEQNTRTEFRVPITALHGVGRVTIRYQVPSLSSTNTPPAPDTVARTADRVVPVPVSERVLVYAYALWLVVQRLGGHNRK